MFKEREIWEDAAEAAVKAGLINPLENIPAIDRAREVRETLKELNVTQTQLSILLGKSQAQLSLWCRGVVAPMPIWVLAVVRALKEGLVVTPKMFQGELSMRQTKEKAKRKMEQFGHGHEKWAQRDDGGWQSMCWHTGGQFGIDKCEFTVIIRPDKTIWVSDPIWDNGGYSYPESSWRVCEFPTDE